MSDEQGPSSTQHDDYEYVEFCAFPSKPYDRPMGWKQGGSVFFVEKDSAELKAQRTDTDTPSTILPKDTKLIVLNGTIYLRDQKPE
ncbi:hypothetical protein ARSEF4850_004316 [Beauveria asiatica]